MTPSEQYIKDVLSGKILTGRLVKLAVERHVRDLKEGHKRGLVYDQSAADKYLEFFKLCNFYKGPKAKQAIVLPAWQQFYVCCLYGWKRKDGTRRFRTSYTEVARKNAKTTIKAVEALAMLFLDEHGAQVYCGATKEEQARILVNDAGNIAEASPLIKEMVETFKNRGTVNRVACIDRQAFIAALGRDSKTQDGFDPLCGIMDEYHAHPTDELLNVIESGMGSRQQPLLNIITTAGFNRNGPCYHLRKNIIDILEGKKEDDATLGLIYSLDEDDDWEDPKNWVKSNPNLGESVYLDFLKDRYVKAKNEGGTKEIDFKTKNLNIWCDAEETWIQDSIWKERTIQEPELSGVPCWGGLDLASTKDIAAFTLLFKLDDLRFYLKHWFFVPKDMIPEREKEGYTYTNWHQNGHLIATEGNVIDYNVIRATILNLRDSYSMQSIAYDSWGATETALYLLDQGFAMNKFGQGIGNMSEPTKKFETMVRNNRSDGERLYNDGNPVMRWMMGNVQIIRDSSGNIKITKGDNKKKVDGPVSAVMALGEMITNPVTSGPSIEIWN